MSGNGLWAGTSDRGVARYYGELSPAERARLALEAAARGDDRERERLVATCPRKDYRMPDADYLDRVDGSRDLALGVVIGIAPELAQARILTPIAELTAQSLAVTMACHVLADARRDADPDTVVADLDAAVAEELPKAKDMSVYRGLEAVRAEQLAKAAAAWTAFSEVCRDELGMEPTVVVAAHLGEEFVNELGLEQLDGVKPGKRLGQWREVFRRGARVGGQP